MRPILLVVPREAEGSRLDRFLASALSAMEGGPSRTELQRWIAHGAVKVDGAVRKAADKLREGARIAVEPEPPPRTAALADAGVEFRVVYMDDAIIVLDKPAGLVVHPARGHATGTLVNGLLARGIFDPPDGDDEIDERPSVSVATVDPALVARVKREQERERADRERASPSPPGKRRRSSAPAAALPPPPPAAVEGTRLSPLTVRTPSGRGIPPFASPDLDRTRPGIVHRLDKGTSGLMVVARHPRSREHLKAQFAAHSIEREYVALCVGRVETITFDTLHGRHPRDRIRFSSKVHAGKRAVTHVRAIEHFGSHATYVACRIETGRTHQIRVHLSDNRTPILADPLYGKTPKHPVVKDAATAIGRPALHARLLGFVHPITKELLRFEVDPPADFQLALATLRAIP